MLDSSNIITFSDSSNIITFSFYYLGRFTSLDFMRVKAHGHLSDCPCDFVTKGLGYSFLLTFWLVCFSFASFGGFGGCLYLLT